MPQELPGFYYDAEKNRYFPIRGPLPGSSSSSSSATAKKSLRKSTNQENKAQMRTVVKTAKLIQMRELYTNVIASRSGKLNFQEEYQKIHASRPLIWEYQGTERIGDGAMEHIRVNIDMPDGPVGTDILLTGGLNGSFGIYELGKLGQQFNYGDECMPVRVWPRNIESPAGCVKFRGHLWRPGGALLQMPSEISCIQMSKKHSPCTVGGAPSMQHVLMTSLGSEASGGSLYILDLSKPLEYSPSAPITWRRVREITRFNSTVWTVDSNSSGSRAVTGTNMGAALVNMETGVYSWICRCKSDVLSLQFDQSGNIVLCGLRNGAILTVDSRQKQGGSSGRLIRHRIPHPYREALDQKSRSGRNFAKQWFELKGGISHSCTTSMPSSISCLKTLRLYDQYFLASSMDGSIKLYDQRMIQRGAVQSYEGNVNSHTRIQFGVDPSERIIVSGGEDCNVRIWDIKSGRLLFDDKFMNSVPSIVCWPISQGITWVLTANLSRCYSFCPPIRIHRSIFVYFSYPFWKVNLLRLTWPNGGRKIDLFGWKISKVKLGWRLQKQGEILV